jgi:pentatricopeptide repeat protein
MQDTLPSPFFAATDALPPLPTDDNARRLRATLALALEQAPQLMDQLVGRALLGLDRQATAHPDAAQRDLMDAAAAAMDTHRSRWVKQLAVMLRVAFAHPSKTALPVVDLRVCESEDMALRELVQQAGSLRGNPLAPSSYIQAIHELLTRTEGDAQHRKLWGAYLLGALGTQLAWVYLQLAACLRTPSSHEMGTDAHSDDFSDYAAYVFGLGGHAPELLPQAEQDEGTQGELTPEMQALAKEAKRMVTKMRTALGMSAPQPLEEGGSQIDRMLRDIDEAERLMQEMQERGLELPSDEPATPEQMSKQIDRLLLTYADASTPSARMPLSLREAMIGLHHPLKLLAQQDDDFLENTDHPVCQFAYAVSQRGLMFGSDQADGFMSFFIPVQKMFAALAQVPQPNARIYSQALERLQALWLQQDEELKKLAQTKEQLLAQLQQRKQLASRLAFELVSRRDAGDAPVPVKQFLMGPWAQVLARAQLFPEHAQDEQRYAETTKALLWSVSTSRAAGQKQRLAQITPALISSLKHGLASVEQPASDVDVFITELAKLHEAVLTTAPTAASQVADDVQLDLLQRT